jgi:hypothetical protein
LIELGAGEIWGAVAFEERAEQGSYVGRVHRQDDCRWSSIRHLYSFPVPRRKGFTQRTP